MPHSSVVTIGNFDGVHQGHRAIIARARRIAQERSARVVAITFDPHPASVLRPGHEPLRLMSTAARVAALRQAGADEVELLQPTPQVLGMEPDVFIQQTVGKHHPIAIVEGGDFHFGKARHGNIDVLRTLGQKHHFDVVVVDPVEVVLDNLHLAPVSSTLVRWLLLRGRVVDATRCLAQPFALTATVVEGERRGRTIGVPTVNLSLPELVGSVIPADGVYAGLAVLKDGSTHAAAISIGVKPTFAGRPRTIEAHLLDFTGDLYGQPVTLRFTRWLRDQQPFPNLESLRRQMTADIDATRRCAACSV